MLSRSGWGSNTGAKALTRGSSRFASSTPVTTPLRTRFSPSAALQPRCVGPQFKRTQGRSAGSCHTPGARIAQHARVNGPRGSSGMLLEAHLQSRCLAWPPSAGLPQRTLTATAAGITAGGGSHEPSHDHATQPASRTLGSMLRGAGKQYTKFMNLTGKFMPMVVLFFLLAFVNTILDSLKDTLVITAAGGGAQVIPYLTVYAVLPSSLVFLLLYSLASQRMSRAVLFNTIVLTFMTFFAIFAYVLYPNHHLIHPHGAADSLALLLPLGVEGLVGMIRNWTFTLFFCMSELWGDVCLGLLFWGLANDTTTLADAPTLYPLFGLGANLAQALAGWVLKVFGSMSQAAALAREEAAVAAGRGLTLAESGFSYEIQSLMMVVMGFALAALSMHSFIDRQHALSKAAATRRGEARQRLKVDAEEVEDRGKGLAGSSSSSSNSGEGVGGSKEGGEKAKPSVLTIFRVLAASVPIRCLAIMSLAQGLCTSLMEFAWKSHISLLYPTPAQFTSFLGDVSVWQGVVTGGLMVLSPALFERLGWKGVASTTPIILMWGGSLFFAACMAFQFFLAGSPQVGLGHLTLQVLVYLGALLYVFSKSAKFSLFKPAEEMVYISLDEEGRTKGKAAIDVVGSQAGKSGGSILQQVLLLASAGQIAGILPILFCFFFAMSKGWLRSVAVLSNHDNYGHPDTVHASIQSVGSPERSPEPSPSPARSAAAAAGKPIQQPLPAPQHLPPAAMSGQTMTEAFGAAGAGAGAAMATAGGVTSNGTHALADVSGNGIEQRSKAVPAAAAVAAAAAAAAAASDATAASAAAAASRS